MNKKIEKPIPEQIYTTMFSLLKKNQEFSEGVITKLEALASNSELSKHKAVLEVVSNVEKREDETS